MPRKHSDQKNNQDFPGGPVDKNPSANAGDMGSIPDLGNFTSRGATTEACSPRACAPVLHKRSHSSEKPARHSWRIPCPETSEAHTPQLGKPVCCNEDPAQPKKPGRETDMAFTSASDSNCVAPASALP